MTKRVTIGLLAIVALVLIVFIWAGKKEKVDFSAVTRESFDENYKRAGLKFLENIFRETSQKDYANILSPSRIYVKDSLFFIYDNSRKVIDVYTEFGTLVSSYFRKGKGEGEILGGTMSMSNDKKYLLFSDIQQNRISIIDIESGKIKMVIPKYLPEEATLCNDKLYIRSFYLSGLVAEIDENGETKRELSATDTTKSFRLNLGLQGGILSDKDLILVTYNHATPIYAYSLTGDSLLFIADTPISIPIPKPYFEKSGNKTTYSTDPKSTILVNLDVRTNDEFIFALYSGGILGEVKSLTDILFTENAKVINIFSKKDGKYLCSAKLSAFIKSFDVQDNKLYAITNLNENELTKLFVYDIDVKKLREVSKK